MTLGYTSTMDDQLTRLRVEYDNDALNRLIEIVLPTHELRMLYETEAEFHAIIQMLLRSMLPSMIAGFAASSMENAVAREAMIEQVRSGPLPQVSLRDFGIASVDRVIHLRECECSHMFGEHIRLNAGSGTTYPCRHDSATCHCPNFREKPKYDGGD